MSKESNFKDKVEELQRKLDSATKSVKESESCFPMLMIVGIVTPFILLLLLFFLQPSFVQKKESNKYVRDGKKIFYWSLGLTIIVWLGLYLYSYCIGYNNTMLCAK